MGAPATNPSLRRHVRDLWPDMSGLFETAEHTSNLVNHQGWLAVQKLLATEMETVDQFLDSAPREHVEYAASHGYRRGLKAAHGAVESILAVSEKTRADQARKHEDGAESPSERED